MENPRDTIIFGNTQIHQNNLKTPNSNAVQLWHWRPHTAGAPTPLDYVCPFFFLGPETEAPNFGWRQPFLIEGFSSQYLLFSL